MKKEGVTIVIFVVLLIISISVVSASTAYIEKEIFSYAKNKTAQLSGSEFKVSGVNVNNDASTSMIPVIITFDSKESFDKIINFLNINQYKIKYKYNFINSISTEVSFQFIETLANQKGINGIYLDRVIQIPPIDKSLEKKLNDIKISNLSLNSNISLMNSVPRINVPQVWAEGIDGSGVKLAILDTGIDDTHPSLTGKVIDSQDFTLDDGKLSTKDGHGHGTHVAGTAAGSGTSTLTLIDTSNTFYSNNTLANFTDLPSPWIELSPFNQMYHGGKFQFLYEYNDYYAIVTKSAAKIENINITDSFIDFPSSWGFIESTNYLEITQPSNRTIKINGTSDSLTQLKVDGIITNGQGNLNWGEAKISYKVGINGYLKIVMNDYNVVYLSYTGNFSDDSTFVATNGEYFKNINYLYYSEIININTSINGNYASVGVDTNYDGIFNELDNFYRGVAPGASLMIGKVCTDYGGCSESDIIAGIEWAVSSGADIISMSLGGFQDICDGKDPESLAVKKATELGTVLTIAGGNSGWYGSETIGSPGCSDSPITVGASEECYFCNVRTKLADFSSLGPTSDGRIKPEILAPGVGICAPQASETEMGYECFKGYVSASGTSMATPHVAGVVALLKEADPSLTPQQIKDILVNSADDLGLSIFSQGSGIVNAQKAYYSLINKNNKVSPSILNLILENNQKYIVNLNTTLSSASVKGYLDKENIETVYSEGNVNSISGFDYEFNISEGLKAFEIRIDWNSTYYSDIDMNLYDSDGEYYGGSFGVQPFESIYVQQPKSGNWRLEVYPYSVSEYEDITVETTLSKIKDVPWNWFNISSKKLEITPNTNNSGLYGGRIVISDNDESITIPSSIIVSLPVTFGHPKSYPSIKNPCINNSEINQSAYGENLTISDREYAIVQDYFCNARERKAYTFNVTKDLPYFDVFINAETDLYFFGDTRLFIYGPDGEEFNSDNYGNIESYRFDYPKSGKWTVIVESEELPFDQNYLYFKGYISYPNIITNPDEVYLSLKKGENYTTVVEINNFLSEDLDFSVDKIIWSEEPIEITQEYNGQKNKEFGYSYSYYKINITPEIINSSSLLKLLVNIPSEEWYGWSEIYVFDGNGNFINNFYSYGSDYTQYIEIPTTSTPGNWTLVTVNFGSSNSPVISAKLMRKTEWNWISVPSHVSFFRGKKNITLQIAVPDNIDNDLVIGGISLFGAWWSGNPGNRVFSHEMQKFIPIFIEVDNSTVSPPEENNSTNSSWFKIYSPKDGEIFYNKNIKLNMTIDSGIVTISYVDWQEKTKKENVLCTKCLEYGYNKEKKKSFSDGLHRLTFKAIKNYNNISEINISFFIDSKDPQISTIKPRSRSFTNGSDFYIKYTEDNIKNVKLRINRAGTTLALSEPSGGGGGGGGGSVSISYTKNCSSGKNQECYFTPNLTSYNGQEISYQFIVTDIANNTDESKSTTIKVDTTTPKIIKFDNWTIGRYAYFNMTINETNFDVVQYIDPSNPRARWITMCSSLRKDICYKKISFSTGQHNILIRILDEAGNSIEKAINFTI